MWIDGISWDEDLPKNVLDRWFEIQDNLYKIDKVSWPNWLGSDRATKPTLHGFADA